MENKIFVRKYIFFLVILGLSCSKDFMDRPPEDALTIDNFYKTEEQVNASTAALYGFPWFEITDKALWTIGEIYSGNMRYTHADHGQFFVFGVTPTNQFVVEAWNSLFRVIAHSNSVINNVPEKAGESVSKSLKLRVVGEARYMRAVAYFYLIRLFGPVPIIENNSEIVFESVIPKNRVEDVFQLAIKDLEYATQNCPESYSGNDVGRITKWAAEAMLAKVYLSRAGWNQNGTRNQADLDSAAQYAGDVINKSGLKLVTNYADLFKYGDEYENSEESLFALQWVACQLWGTQNTTQAFWAKNSTLTGTGDGWGLDLAPTIDLQDAYEAGDLRRHATIMQDGDYYPELLQNQGGYTYVVAPDDDEPESGTFANVRKYIVGTPDDNEEDVCSMSNGLNTYMQRLSDVYLIYAEAILGNNASTSDENAINAFNTVRNRAGLAGKSSITFDDILHERRIEFAFESSYWFDLVNLHYWNSQKAIDIIKNQERGSYYWDNGVKTLESYKVEIVNDNDFTLPIPVSELDQNPLLGDDPVPYIFD